MYVYPHVPIHVPILSLFKFIQHFGPYVSFFGGGIIVHSAWGCVLWVAQWRAARALDSQLEGLVGPV